MLSALSPLLTPAAVSLGKTAAAAAGAGLSFAGELLRAAEGAAAPATESSGVDAAATSPGASWRERLSALTRRLEARLAAAGVALVQPAEIARDAFGRLAVAGPHPQRPAIEEALASDVLLERDLDLLAADYDALRAAGAEGDLPAAFSITVPSR